MGVELPTVSTTQERYFVVCRGRLFYVKCTLIHRVMLKEITLACRKGVALIPTDHSLLRILYEYAAATWKACLFRIDNWFDNLLVIVRERMLMQCAYTQF